MSGDAVDQPVFFYDLGDPESYLAAERIMAALPVVPEWEPVLGAELGIGPGAFDALEFDARAAAGGWVQPIRWPSAWPTDSRKAMLAATYAKHVGRAVAFSLAAFRQAFAGGRDLGDEDNVLIAAAACEMHPAAVLKALTLRSVSAGLAGANARARAAGIERLPAIALRDELFTGPDAVEDAVAALERRLR